jgi:membrane-bound metal-dependent hydrolase YbcI (DUF457 family)
MPSPIGHTLAGLTVGWLADRDALRPLPSAGATWTARVRASCTPLVLWCAAMAALPDADLLIPHFHRTVTHSVTVTFLILIIAAAVTGKVTRPTALRIAVALAAAHSTHLLLDWLGTDRNPPAGLQMFWPFDDRFYISDWDIFPPVARGRISSRMIVINANAALWEIALMLPVAATAWVWRRFRCGRPASAKAVATDS